MSAQRIMDEATEFAIVDESAGLVRGLYYGFVFVLPLWGAVIALAKLVL